VLAANGQGLETVVVRPRLIWGAGDTNLIPKLVEAVKSGRWMWMGGGTALTSSCHVKNACHGALLAAEKGRPGEVYFVTDGAPVDYKSFLGALIRAWGADPGEKKLPLWLAKISGHASEAAWRLLRLKGAPPVTRTAVMLLGQEVTVSDAKARRELGYAPVVTREEGLRELSQQAAAR
jgi:nucleoside-diphosphate-sugar epimerase